METRPTRLTAFTRWAGAALGAGALTYGFTLLGGACLPESALSPTVAHAQLPGLSDPNTISDVAERVLPSVVTIAATAEQVVRVPDMPSPFQGFLDPFYDFNGRRGGSHEERFEQRGIGSGFVVDGGYIVTNSHVVSSADELEVLLPDGRSFKAKLVGNDRGTDVALLKLDTTEKLNLPALSWGDSDALRLGEIVLAVGAPLELSGSVTMGIVSAKGRDTRGSAGGYGSFANGTFIQTDAAVNPGNSGGPLVNLRGEVVGINSFIATPNGTFVGYSFAVPSSVAKTISATLADKGRVVRGYLGVQFQPIDERLAKGLGTKEGVIVTEVVSKSPAEKAGIQPGDVIQRVGDKAIDDGDTLRWEIATSGPGRKVELALLRDGKAKSVAVVLDELPEGGREVAESQKPDGKEQSGLQLQALDDDLRRRLQVGDDVRSGVVVKSVEPGSAAEEAGLQQGDVIVEINRSPVATVDDVLKPWRQGGDLLLRVKRGRGTMFLMLTK
jgi:Do/DeqQ family serine protease